MTDNRPPILEELDDIAIGPAPVGEILRTSREAKHRRRAVLASVAAVSALVIGGGVVTSQFVANSDEGESLVADGPATTSLQSRDLTVNVEPFTPTSSNVGVWTGLARWDANTQVLDYLSRADNYGTGCQPTATATVTDDSVNLDLRAPEADLLPCANDAQVGVFMLTTITGLTEAPSEFTVTENGEQRTVRVADTDTTPPVQATTPVTLTVGHCFVEPVNFNGTTWVTRRLYVGYGGGLPTGFTPSGTFEVISATRARFEAEGGGLIEFKPLPLRQPQQFCR